MNCISVFTYRKLALALTLSVAGCLSANVAAAAMIITEVDPAGSASASGYGGSGGDWFELTNTGSSAVDITGWKMDDNSNSFASAVALTGITNIGAGQSAIFLQSNGDGSNAATVVANFKSIWFGSNVPVGLSFGTYIDSGTGLSQTADAVNVYNSAGVLQANVSFGASSLTSGTFDNTAGLNNVTLTQLSVVGVNGAFTSANGEIGSPGVTPVPVPAALPLLLSALGGLAAFRRRRG